MTLANPGAVSDCVFRGDSASGTWTALATDDSGVGVNLTSNTNSAYETNSARSNLTDQRTVDVELALASYTTDQGTLWRWDRGGGDHSTLRWGNTLGNARIEVTVDGFTTQENFLLSTQPAANDDYLVSWAMEPNPDMSNDSDAMRSEIFVTNLTTGDYEIFVFYHETEAGTDTGTLIFGANNTSDGDFFPGTITDIRLSSSFHSTVETREVFEATTSAPTLDGNEYRPFPIPLRSDVPIGDDGQFSGPVLIMAAKAAEQHRMLCAGPVVNDVNNDGDFIGGVQVSGKTVGYTVQDTNPSQLRMEHLYWRPIPVGASHVVPYVHIQYNESAAVFDLELKVNSMNWPGPISTPDNSSGAFERYFVTSTISTNHGTGNNAGEWVSMPKLKIARDDIGWSYFCVGLYYDSANGATVRINSICLDPIVSDEGDGLGIGGLVLG